MENWIITATPPTPNGDLHVGHLSGPYIAADVFRRARLYAGHKAEYLCYGDDNQSYVETTAQRLDVCPKHLASSGNADIKRTLSAFDIEMVDYGIPGELHNEDVTKGFHALYKAGVLQEVEKLEPCDAASGVMLFESYLTGRCSHCLCTTKCGICESCGHPNKSETLLKLDDEDIKSPKQVIKKEKKLVLEVEPYRDQLTSFIESKRGVWRPHILELADQLLGAPLADIDISFRAEWGLDVGLDGWDGHVFNVWAEMGLGLIAQADRECANGLEGSLVQFLGYDNSYFFLVMHPVLHFALESIGFPNTKLVTYIYTNEFYNLDGRKFSTSQGHLIWGRDLLKYMSSDQARYYLMKNGPELASSNFVLESALSDVRSEFSEPIYSICTELSNFSDEANYSIADVAVPSQLALLVERYEYYSDPMHFSAASIARIVGELLGYLSQCGFDNTQDYLVAIKLWAELAGPITPKISSSILRCYNTNSEVVLSQLIYSLHQSVIAKSVSVSELTN